jgi:hypothetical protein
MDGWCCLNSCGVKQSSRRLCRRAVHCGIASDGTLNPRTSVSQRPAAVRVLRGTTPSPPSPTYRGRNGSAVEPVDWLRVFAETQEALRGDAAATDLRSDMPARRGSRSAPTCSSRRGSPENGASRGSGGDQRSVLSIHCAISPGSASNDVALPRNQTNQRLAFGWAVLVCGVWCLRRRGVGLAGQSGLSRAVPLGRPRPRSPLIAPASRPFP